MFHRQRLPVHFVSQQRIGIERLLHIDGALELGHLAERHVRAIEKQILGAVFEAQMIVAELPEGTTRTRTLTVPVFPLTESATIHCLSNPLVALGPDATLSTSVVRDGQTLYLVGGGDVTLRAFPGRGPVGYPPAATLADLGARTAAALGPARVTPLRVCVDTSAWAGPASAPGWSPGYFTGALTPGEGLRA